MLFRSKSCFVFKVLQLLASCSYRCCPRFWYTIIILLWKFGLGTTWTTYTEYRALNLLVIMNMFGRVLYPAGLIDLSHYLQPNDLFYIRKKKTIKTKPTRYYLYPYGNIIMITPYWTCIKYLFTSYYIISDRALYARVYGVVLLLLYYIVPKLCNHRQGWGGLLYTRNNTKRLKTFFVPTPVLITPCRNLSVRTKVFEFRNTTWWVTKIYIIHVYAYMILLVKRAINTRTIYYNIM